MLDCLHIYCTIDKMQGSVGKSLPFENEYLRLSCLWKRGRIVIRVCKILKGHQVLARKSWLEVFLDNWFNKSRTNGQKCNDRQVQIRKQMCILNVLP